MNHWRRVEPGIQKLMDGKGKEIGSVAFIPDLRLWVPYFGFPADEPAGQRFSTAWEAKWYVESILSRRR